MQLSYCVEDRAAEGSRGQQRAAEGSRGQQRVAEGAVLCKTIRSMPVGIGNNENVVFALQKTTSKSRHLDITNSLGDFRGVLMYKRKVFKYRYIADVNHPLPPYQL